MSATATATPATSANASGEQKKPRGRRANPERAAEMERRKAMPGADKRGRLPYPALASNPEFRLDGIPADFDLKWHQPLQKQNFKAPADFYAWEIAQTERKLASLKRKAEQAKLAGAGDEGKKRAKLIKTVEATNALIQELVAGGMTREQIEALMEAAKMNAAQNAQPAPAAPAAA